MADTLGWRRVIAVVGPSTNTTVEPEFEAMRPAGVTFAYRAFLTEDPAAPITDVMFSAGVAAMGEGLQGAVRQAMSCKPDGIALGISIVSFQGGLAGAQALQEQLQNHSGVPVTLPSLALAEALRALGGIRRVALLTPYVPAANASVKRFLTEAGFEVRRDIALQAPSWTGIAQIAPQRLVHSLRELDGDDVDAFVQVGTNLPFLSLAREAEVWLGKPLLPVNVATCWHTLRSHGIADVRDDCGPLFRI